jgi:hypothetical protein
MLQSMGAEVFHMRTKVGASLTLWIGLLTLGCDGSSHVVPDPDFASSRADDDARFARLAGSYALPSGARPRVDFTAIRINPNHTIQLTRRLVRRDEYYLARIEDEKSTPRGSSFKLQMGPRPPLPELVLNLERDDRDPAESIWISGDLFQRVKIENPWTGVAAGQPCGRARYLGRPLYGTLANDYVLMGCAQGLICAGPRPGAEARVGPNPTDPTVGGLDTELVGQEHGPAVKAFDTKEIRTCIS